ncbi:hypothetical protein TRAPUB_14068 [Trametes pubescens]|uniref:BTB domain-containing protein n=1 Tax=Trametes pubescens TaxID=154538 RepID=A0A1M2VPD7_TRAPU|nr:hypothetical protein TRAPUB_14068 [Trametes pubescens]
MSNSAGSHKRRRTAFDAQQSVDSTVEASTTITRDTEFWFEDGTIILVAKNVQFRVFKGILSDHSPVFRDMFSLPQPASASILQGATDAFDACPVVHLSDSPEDLRHVLRACIPKSDSNFNLFIQKDPSFPAISAIICIGHKYQMQHLVAQGVQYPKRHFTDDLAAWANGTLCSRVRRRPQAQAIAIFNIARLINEPSLLPTALLMCCSLDQAIINGWYTREDGTRETLSLEDRASFRARNSTSSCPLRSSPGDARLHFPDASFERVHTIGGVNRAHPVDEPALPPTARAVCRVLLA